PFVEDAVHCDGELRGFLGTPDAFGVEDVDMPSRVHAPRAGRSRLAGLFFLLFLAQQNWPRRVSRERHPDLDDWVPFRRWRLATRADYPGDLAGTFVAGGLEGELRLRRNPIFSDQGAQAREGQLPERVLWSILL